MQYSMLKDLVEKPISGEWGNGDGAINVIRTTNFTNNGRINFTKIVSRDVPENKVKAKKLLIDDIIIEKSGGSPTQPVGRVVFFDRDGLYLCNNFTSVLRPLKQLVYPKYLHYILFCNHKFGYVTKFQNKTTGIINLQLAKYLKNTKIPLPPLAEQQQIAAILDAADSLRQKDQQLIDHYTALNQSLFLNMFGDSIINSMGWDKDLMENACAKITDGTHDTPERLKEGIKFITGKHIKPYVIDYINSDYVSQDVHAEIFRRCNPNLGDVLYTNIGVNLGTAALNTVDYEFSMKNVALLKPNKDSLTGRFLEYYLNNKFVKDKIIWMASAGGAQKFLSLSQLRKLDILLPPITLQNQFAERIAIIEQQKQQAKASLDKSETLFNSLLQRAFNGELTGRKAA